MNKNDMNKLCILVVEWEFGSGTASEAIGRAACISDLRREFSITAEDLSSYRASEICRKIGEESEEFFDAVCDLVDENFEGLMDAIDDAKSFDVVRAMVEQKSGAAPKFG